MDLSVNYTKANKKKHQPLHLKTPNCISPLPKAQFIKRIVGISLKDLKKEDKPNLKNIFGRLTPSKIDSHHEGNVSLVQSSVSTWLFANTLSVRFL